MRSLASLLLACITVLATAQETGTGASVGGPVSPSGLAAQAPVAKELHLRNTVGTDGSGLCVFTSISLSAIFQNVPDLMGFRDWMKKYRGGGWPQKVDQMIAALCKEKGVDKPAYLQVEGNDLAILELACKTGRLPAVTYGISPTKRYGGQWIAHMVNLSHARGDEFAVVDNNYPGSWEWMTRAEFQRAYKGRGQGWCVVLLSAPPPPAPANDLPPEPK